MTYRAEFMIQTAPFMGVHFIIEGMNKSQFFDKINDFNDADKAKLGVFMAEIESHVKVAHQEILSGAPVEPVDALVKGVLGGQVVSVQEPGEEPVEPSWSAPVERAPKPWENADEKPLASGSLFD